jgi:hypothetical protein
MRLLFWSLLFVTTSLPAYAQRTETPANDQAIAKSLDSMLARTRPLDEFILEMTWAENGKTTSLTIYGDGLGIHWQGNQFQLSAEDRLAILRKLKVANFAALPEKLGGLAKEKGDKPDNQDSQNGHGTIKLRIGSQSKTVQHAREGPANETFVKLAKDLAKMGMKQSAGGIGIESLADGLQKILDKKIDPRALKIKEEYLRHQACHTFEVEGLDAKISGLGYWGEPFKGQKSVTVDEMTKFIAKMQQHKFHELPTLLNLTDDIFVISVTVRVLDKEHCSYGYGYDSKKSPKNDLLRLHEVWRSSRGLHPEYLYEKRKFK